MSFIVREAGLLNFQKKIYRIIDFASWMITTRENKERMPKVAYYL